MESANDPDTDFPIQNLPFGIFRRRGSEEQMRGGVAIGDQILDLAAVCESGWLTDDVAAAARMCCASQLNTFMEAGLAAWSALRLGLSRLLRAGSAPDAIKNALLPQAEAEMALPAAIGDYTDFYTSYEHAFNAGSLLRPQNPLFPNFKYIPVAYHSRSSSICVSGTDCVRPRGQSVAHEGEPPGFGPTRRLDYELELGVFVGPGTAQGRAVPLGNAWQHVFGLCLLNDWSARDIQRWETQPLGPFLGKNFLTSISPWIVTLQALAPFMAPWRRRGTDDLGTLPLSARWFNDSSGAADINVFGVDPDLAYARDGASRRDSKPQQRRAALLDHFPDARSSHLQRLQHAARRSVLNGTISAAEGRRAPVACWR